MSFGRFLLGNVIGTALVVLVGLLMGMFVSWIAGLFLPESIKPMIAGAVFVLAMLGIPGIWVSNWRRYQLMKLVDDGVL